MMEKPKSEPIPTWDELCELEPRLADLLNEIKQIKDDKKSESFCANAIWYGGGYRNAVDALVGWHAKKNDPRLRTSTAYEMAYRTLYAALPNCRNCNCL